MTQQLQRQLGLFTCIMLVIGKYHRRRNFHDAGRNRARLAVGGLGAGRVDHRRFSRVGRARLTYAELGAMMPGSRMAITFS